MVGGSADQRHGLHARPPIDGDGWADADEFSGTVALRARAAVLLGCLRAQLIEASAYRGVSALEVTRGATENALYDAFLQAGEQAGQGTSDDLNGFKPEAWRGWNGTGRATADGPRRRRRTSSLRARAREPPIVTERGRGQDCVEISNGEPPACASTAAAPMTAKREVLLCAGAIKTPQLLMLSGWRQGAARIGVDVVADLSGRAELDGPRLRQYSRRMHHQRCH